MNIFIWLSFPVVVAVLSLTGCSSQQAGRSKAEPSPPPDLRVTISDDAARNLGVIWGSPELLTSTETWRVTGNIQPIDSRVAHLRPLARGRILEVHTTIGARVKANQPLVRYDNIEAGELRAQYGSGLADLQRMKVQLAAATRVVERNRNLLNLGAVAAKELELAEAEQHSIEEHIKAQDSALSGIVAKLQRFGLVPAGPSQAAESLVRSPFEGLITEQNASVGEVVDISDVLFAVADTRELWVQADVYEKDLSRLSVNARAQISTAAYPDRMFPAKVSYIGDQVDPDTRTVHVRCEISNPSGLLKIGMFVWVDLPRVDSKTDLSVPLDAVQEIDSKPHVFLRDPDGHIHPRPVTTAPGPPGRILLTAGVSATDRLAVAGAFHLKSMITSQAGGN